MLSAPLLKALSFLMSVLVSFVPALAPYAGGADATAASTGDGPQSLDDPAFTKLDALLDATAKPDANATEDDATDAAPVEDAEPEPAPNVTFVKPKRAPEPVVFSARWDEKKPHVQPGGAVPLRLIVTNHYLHPIQVNVATGNVTPGWAVTMHTKYLELDPGEEVEIPVTFEAPFEARPGSSGRFSMLLTSGFPFVTRAFPLTAHVPVPVIERGVDAYASDATRYASPGDVVNYTITVQNAGNANDTFTLSALGGAYGWTASFTDRRVSLGPSESARVVMSVSVPANARDGDASFMNVTVRSVSDPQARADATTFTTVNAQNRGLPVALEPICVNRPVDVPYEAEAYAPERLCIDLARYVPDAPFGVNAEDTAENAAHAADSTADAGA